jgi:hypothetical protein
MGFSNPSDLKFYLRRLEELLDLYLVKKAPSLPTDWKELFVNFAPWLAIIIIIFSLPVLLITFGLGALILPFSFLGGASRGFHYGFDYFSTLIFVGSSLVLNIMALPGLFKRTRRSWYLVYYAALLSGIYNILTLSLMGFILGSGIILYILFQIKEYYTN